MKNKYLIASVALATVLAISSIASAQYEDMIRDDEGNVMRFVGEDEWEFTENDDIDIIQVELSETEDWVMVSLTVKGTIQDHPDIIYVIEMRDENNNPFDLEYNDGESTMTAFGSYVADVATNGVGTNTLQIVFTREQIGNPGDLSISAVYAYNEGVAEVDMAGPNAEYPPGYEDTYQEPVDDPDDGIPEGPRDDTDEVNGTPGLGFMSLVLGLLFVVGAYYKKKR